MSRIKIGFLVIQITAAMVFFQNCSEVSFENAQSDQVQGKMAVDLANEYPFRGENISQSNEPILNELTQDQLVECELNHDDALSNPSKARNCKVTICHKPKGNVENAHTISISVMALSAHIDDDGLDYLGACDDVDEQGPGSVTTGDGEYVSYDDGDSDSENDDDHHHHGCDGHHDDSHQASEDVVPSQPETPQPIETAS